MDSSRFLSLTGGIPNPIGQLRHLPEISAICQRSRLGDSRFAWAPSEICEGSPVGKGKKRSMCSPAHSGGTKREHATSAPAELGGKIHNVSRNRARTQVPLQARKLHVYGRGTFGAFWPSPPRSPTRSHPCHRRAGPPAPP